MPRYVHEHMTSVATLGITPLHGERVLVAVVLDGNSGPHEGVIDARLPSGRYRVEVPRAGRTFRVITDARNVYPLGPTAEGFFR